MWVSERTVSWATRVCEWDSWHILALSLVCVSRPCYCKISLSGYIYHIFWIGIWSCCWQIPCFKAWKYYPEIHTGSLLKTRVRLVSHCISHCICTRIAALRCDRSTCITSNCRCTTRCECFCSMRNCQLVIGTPIRICYRDTWIILAVSRYIIWCPIDCKSIWTF